MPIQKRPFPDVLTGTSVCLKRLTESHAQQMFDCIQRDKARLLRYLPWPQYINSVEDELEFIKSARGHFDDFAAFDYGIFQRVDDSFLGTITSFNIDPDDMSYELGYWLLGAGEGKGRMTEAMTMLVREHDLRGFHRAVALCEPGNTRSAAVVTRCGFSYEGTLRHCKWNGSAFLDMQVFARLTLSEKRPAAE